ncbi:phage terminase, small subunit, putative, P27 family [Saccharopolyspora kobensis]|uniref:Phage terminase, small subunit, putative, P27 family n=1 Tax=Saccharopolyspora kobensis TaxID=146035 RepID=A0A1H6DZQ1_9PSEU|nr:phage terminase small subunit P27 family [Saccharopolyspora kobensis]SEG90812.1 phage terminase, small subunit, putative, P27 family [Saccharopolyspora kobensis]SFD94012.1 phage terminase, small subunit, putative, P27 family [Saccharopolyspora kobensis]
MGLRGPLPAADNVRHLRGTPPRAGAGRPVKAAPQAPNPPSWLDREARAEWRRVVPELGKLGILARLDRAVLAAYCDAWSRWVQARTLIDENGLVVHNPERGWVKNPAWQVYRDACSTLQALAKELGTTPNTRLRMTLPERDADDDGAALLD